MALWAIYSSCCTRFECLSSLLSIFQSISFYIIHMLKVKVKYRSITFEGRRGVAGFCARHFSVSRHRDGGACLLSVAILPVEGSRRKIRPHMEGFIKEWIGQSFSSLLCIADSRNRSAAITAEASVRVPSLPLPCDARQSHLTETQGHHHHNGGLTDRSTTQYFGLLICGFGESCTIVHGITAHTASQ